MSGNTWGELTLTWQLCVIWNSIIGAPRHTPPLVLANGVLPQIAEKFSMEYSALEVTSPTLPPFRLISRRLTTDRVTDGGEKDKATMSMTTTRKITVKPFTGVCYDVQVPSVRLAS